MRALLAILLLSATLASAAPLFHTGTTYYGVATLGSRDHAMDWTPDRGCADVVTTFEITLSVLDGAPATALLLEGPRGATPAVAALGSPARIVAEHPSSCVDFTVTGLVVAGTAFYRVETRIV